MKRHRIWIAGLLTLLVFVECRALQLGGRSAKEWADVLESDERLEGLKVREVIANLKLKPGDQVADIGAGTGVFCGPLARAIAPGGTLFAVEIDQELLDLIAERARQEAIENIHTVLGTFSDPKLPNRQLDLVFFHDALHHIEKRQPYLKTVVSYLNPKGRVAVVDIIKDHPDAAHQDQPEMQLDVEEVIRWMAEAGFQIESQFDLFEDKFFLIFGPKP